jgi:hypothetical protein
MRRQHEGASILQSAVHIVDAKLGAGEVVPFSPLNRSVSAYHPLRDTQRRACPRGRVTVYPRHGMVRPVTARGPLGTGPGTGPSDAAGGETWASKRGVNPSQEGCRLLVRSIKRSVRRRKETPARRPTGSRARQGEAKARGGQSLEGQSRGNPRRRGRGTLGQISWEQESPVSALAERLVGWPPTGGQGASSPISGNPVKWVRVERESERPIVPTRPRHQKHGGGMGPYLVCVSEGGKGW